MIRHILKSISWFLGCYNKKPTTNTRNQPSYTAKDIFPKKDNIESIVNHLDVGDISENTNYTGIQEFGKHISPVGNDPLHLVIIYQHKDTQRVKIAQIKTTNQMYSEWIIACCNTMWKTKHKVFKDVDGNIHPVGQLLECTATIRYR